MISSALRARLALAAGALLLAACDADRVLAPADSAAAIAVPRPSLSLAEPTSNQPTLPLATVALAPTTSTGRTIRVGAGGSLQSAINAAVPGDLIVLSAGATFTGNFYLPKKSGTGWVTIRTSTSDAYLPRGRRVSPGQAGLLAKLVSPNGGAALRTYAGAHHYRLVGLEITAKSGVTASTRLVALGSGSRTSQSTLASVPHYIAVERSYIHGLSTMDLKNCVELHAAHASIVDSYLDRCHSKVQESHGIIGWNGPGPFLIENNYVAAGHINVMFGGATPASSSLVPSDITIRRNHVTKPLTWKATWPAKNLVEFKIGRRILLEGNVLENSWVSQQSGFALVVKTAVGSSADTWGRTEDVTLRRNLVRNAAAGIAISARDGSYGLPARRIRLEHNVWDGIGASNGTTNGRIFQVLRNVHGVQIERNTAIHSSTSAHMVVTFGGGTVDGFVVRDNIVTRGAYGVKGDNTAEGTDALVKRAPGYVFANNAIVGAPATKYPTRNYFPSSLSNVGFVSLANRDYRLASTSPLKGKAGDGTDPGANVAAVTTLTTGVVR